MSDGRIAGLIDRTIGPTIGRTIDRALEGPIGRGLGHAVERGLTSGLVPTPILRAAIRAVCARRLRDEEAGGPAAQAARREALLTTLRAGPIATATPAANRQHYEVPTEFFEQAPV